MRELFSLIAEFDRREAYKIDGARSMADWLGYRLGVLDSTARDWCRSANALEGLPEAAASFEDGSLSWDKVRCLTEFATPDEDTSWAQGASAAEVRTYAQQRKCLAREACDRRFRRRYLKIVPDLDEGVVRFWGRLADTEGMAFKKAVDRLTEQMPVGKLDERRADALAQLASSSLGADADPDRATVVCHVDAAVLGSEDGVAFIDGAMPVGAETVRRLLCDGRLQGLVHDAAGAPIGVGKVSRVVPHYLRRALLDRDGGCSWPGCSAAHWLHAHHIVHVAHGGRTDEDNLVMLCAFHHRCVHEGGWKIRGPARDLRIRRPDGTTLGSRHLEPELCAVARGP
jgi:hypothetical protein